MNRSENIRVELKSQEGTSHDAATVKIYSGERLIAEITASIEQKHGADGGLYPCVILREKPIISGAITTLSSLEKFHLLAAAAPEEVPDSVVEKALISVVIEKQKDINEIVGILERNRPELLKKLKNWVVKQKSATC